MAFIELSGINKIICKGQFYKISKEIRCSDVVLKPPVGEGVLGATSS